MIEITHETKCHGSVLSIGVDERHLLVLDNAYHLSILSPDTLVSHKSVSLLTKTMALHQFSHAIQADDNGHILIGAAGSGRVVHYSLLEGTDILDDNVWHEDNIGSVAFDPTRGYYASGGDDGRVHLFRYESSSWETSFEIRPDYISYLGFSGDGSLLLSAAYDKKVAVYDVPRQQQILEFDVSSVVESALFFDNNTKICCITRHKRLEVYDLRAREMVFSEELFDSWPTAMVMDTSGRYIIVGTKQNKLFIISLEGFYTIAQIELDVHGVSALKLTTDALYVGTIDGAVLRVNALLFLEEFKSALTEKDYKKAYAQLDRNVLLYFNPASATLDEDWPGVLAEAKKLIEAQKIDSARDLTGPFTQHNPHYSHEFLSFFSDNKEILELAHYIDKKLFHAAYELVEQHPNFKMLQLYQKLEGEWFLACKKARQAMAAGTYDGKLEAEKIMRLFLLVPEKEPMIQQLLSSSGLFEQAEKLVKEKQFPAYFKLVESAPFLQDTELYSKTMALSRTLHDKIVSLEQAKQWDMAIQLLEILKTFPHAQKTALEHLTDIKLYREFLVHIERNERRAAYDKAQQSSYLQSSNEFQKLVDIFNADCDRVYTYAIGGKPYKILETLGEYFEIRYWNPKLKSMMKTAYANEMKNCRHPDSIDWDATLRSYIYFFGKDINLERVVSEIDGFDPGLLARLEDNENPPEELGLRDYPKSILINK